ncbi:microtubule organization protein AKNA-like [Scomber japonicus]|uniref:microtubule organization protein AKNA-like n=1 Tax=Scomber japonicus TaxID=13676 RepID=UPI0023061A83|nr:microtubule organization protein AKNA-like [Scomber japonicus]
MEGEPEESDEDVQGEDKPTVLWEKCIQQSIIVDLSEDESLHFSDLEGSLALHLSQAESAASEASIHLSGSAELSALDDTSSNSSVVSSHSEREVGSKTKSSKLQVSAQRPNTMQDEGPLNQWDEDSGQSTSDEDQEDLPYDGDLGSPYFNQTGSSQGNMSSDGRETVHASPDVSDLHECTTGDSSHTLKHLAPVEPHAEKPVILCQEEAPSCTRPADGNQLQDINQLLLRHFSQEELLRSGRLIEAETLPEVSLLESVDETLFSWAPAHNGVEVNSNYSESRPCESKINQSLCYIRTGDERNNASKNSSLEEEKEKGNDSVTSAVTDSITLSSKHGSSDNSALNVVSKEKTEEDGPVRKVPFVRTRSFNEMKYGQGQVHYPHPDFSKVAPKVKIPKVPSGSARPVPQVPSTMHRAQSSPGMLEVISKILDDSIQPSEKPFVFKDLEKQTPPALVHHLQAEYDKLLTKYAEAENIIDQLRLETNTQPSSELMLDDDDMGNLGEGSHLGSLAPHIPPSEICGEKVETNHKRNIKELNKASSSQPDPECPSDGEQMTSELRDIISQFMRKVEELKLSVSNMSFSTAEQQMILRSMMEAQDQLERKYISKKDEHRALEMQNYMGLSRNTGTFDPNRLVEGDIFRIGMHLEDIKEMIDKTMYDQISPPHSSSTPTPMTELLYVKPSPLGMHTASPLSLHELHKFLAKSFQGLKIPESVSFSLASQVPCLCCSSSISCWRASFSFLSAMLLAIFSTIFSSVLSFSKALPEKLFKALKGSSAGFSTVSYKMETQTEEEENKEVEETGEVHGEGRLEQSSELITTDSLLKNTAHGSHCSRSVGSLEGLNTPTAEDEEGNEDERNSVLSEGIVHGNILAYLSGTSSPSRQRQWTPESSPQDSVLNPDSECDLVDCVSLAVEVSYSSDAPRDRDTNSLSEPPLNTSSRIVSPETDSGFGSSYLSQSAPGVSQPNLHPESVQSQNGGLSSSDSEGSCSNLQTTIHPASQWWASPQTQSGGAATAVELWVKSTTKEPSVRVQGSEPSLPAQLHHHVSEPTLSTTMDTAQRDRHMYSCSCNSEAILALQSEVSRLKKDLKEGLVQLPHLAQKMDYLTSKNRQDRQERRSKTRPRTHHRPAFNSQVRIEDWISSDMNPSKSKGTDSDDMAGSEILPQFHDSPVGSRRGSKSSALEFQYKLQGTLQASRAAVMESYYSKERWSLFSPASRQRPLLQVSYGSSSSLPASYKVREPPLQSVSHHRKRSTQSDTALLPSNVYFKRTLSPVSVLSKSGDRAGRRRGTKEEEMNRTLDQAIEVARNMKRTTDRMAKSLSADLAKLHNIQPLGSRKHHVL